MERERIVVGGLLLLLFLTVSGFLVHRDPLFPGSLAGGLLGISAATLLLIPLAYLFIKRIAPLRKGVTTVVSMKALLAIHIYAGVLGPILGVLHSGHRFQSSIGIWLTAMMLVVAASGFIGRHLLRRLSTALQADAATLPALKQALVHVRIGDAPGGARARDAARLAGAIADVELHSGAIGAVRVIFTRWLACHIVIALIFYGLLALHVWSSWYFGIRWLQ